MIHIKTQILVLSVTIIFLTFQANGISCPEEAKVYQESKIIQLCLNPSNETIYRICAHRNTSSNFEDCTYYPSSRHSRGIYEIYKTKISAPNITNSGLVNIRDDISETDIWLISQILEKLDCLSFNNEDLQNFLEIIDDIMNLSKIILETAEIQFNATERILGTLQNCLVLTSVSGFNYSSENFNIVEVNAYLSANVSIAVYKNGTIKYLTDGVSEELRNDRDLEYATHTIFPGTYDDTSHHHCFISLFHNENLFIPKLRVLNIKSTTLALFFHHEATLEMGIYYNLNQTRFMGDAFLWKHQEWTKTSTAKEIDQGIYKTSFNLTDRQFYLKFLMFPQLDYCPPHKITAGEDELLFPETPRGAWATPTNKICLLPRSVPYKIKCLEDSTWDAQPDGHCSEIDVSETTSQLFNMSVYGARDWDPVRKICVARQSELKALDVYYISQIFDNYDIDGDADKISTLFESVNGLMQVDRKILKDSQEVLNATDKLLDALDRNLVKNKLFSADFSGIWAKSFQSSELVNAVGVLILKDHSTVFLNSSNYKKNIFDRDVEVALVSNNLSQLTQLYISLFQNDFLFNQAEEINLNSKVLNILIPTDLPEGFELEIYFKECESCELNKKCVHWNYGNDRNFVAKQGRWKFDMAATDLGSGIFMCKFNHTTHFGMLLPSPIRDNLILNLITYFGAVLSIIGLLIIFLTAIVFKNWRRSSNNKIILNISASNLLLIIFLIAASTIGRGSSCVAIGALLHYILLTNFFWTISICYSNYRRFVREIHFQIENVILKYSIFSWGAPLLFVIANLSINYRNYDKTCDDKNSICYPKKLYYVLTVLLPISIILAINLFVYVLIIRTISATKIFDIDKQSVHNKKRGAIWKSMFLLFFLMGLVWILGTIGAIFESTVKFSVFSYLFCVTVTLQGFVMFLFYILDSKNTREMWRRKIYEILKLDKFTRKSGSNVSSSRSAQTESAT